MAERFDFFSLPHTTNPFGVLFQPLAILQLVDRAVTNQQFTLEDLSQRDDIWYSYQAHSSLSGIEAEEVVNGLNAALAELRSAIEKSSHVVITLGTAWVYRHLASDSIVANCHKQPGTQFSKELLNPQQIENSLKAVVTAIRKLNSKAVFIFTVSPVRHIKDGMTENARSKAHLLTAVHNVIESSEHTFYFPAYEIMMDELRDYRYYNSDLIHPNNQAIFHIWDGFKEAWVAESAKALFNRIGGLKAAMNHTSQIPGSNAHRDFKNQLAQSLEEFRAEFPHISI